MADTYKKSVTETIDKAGTSPAIVITDAHWHGDIINEYAIELAKSTHRTLGLEFFSRAEESFIKALERKEITKSDFIKLMNPESTTPEDGEMRSYIGQDRAHVYYSKIADAVQNGLKIRSLGTVAGMHPALNNENTIKLVENIQELDAKIALDFIKFQKDGKKEEIDKNPKAFLKEYLTQVDRQFKEMPEIYKEQFSSRIEKLNVIKQKERDGSYTNDSDVRAAIKSVFETLHPMSEDRDFKQNQWSEIAKSAPNLPFNLKDRQSTDNIIADKVVDLLAQEEKIIIVYGRGHTSHGKRDGFDLDKNLRDKGIDVAIIDPQVPKEKQSPDFYDKNKKELVESSLADVAEEIANEKDPKRYSIELNAGEVSPLPQQPIQKFSPR